MAKRQFVPRITDKVISLIPYLEKVSFYLIMPTDLKDRSYYKYIVTDTDLTIRRFKSGFLGSDHARSVFLNGDIVSILE